MLNAVKIINGKAVTTSRKIAEVFEKQHKDVLRVIRELDIPEDFGQRNFTPAEYEAVNNLGKAVKYPEYLITRDGFVILAMGFTGKKAMEFKVAYINAFNAMEEELKSHCHCHPTANREDLAASTVELLNKLNCQLIAGMEVDKEVLRYAWNIGKLMEKPVRRIAGTTSALEDYVWSIQAGAYTRHEIYKGYCKSCRSPLSARMFWPRVREIRPCCERRQSNCRLVVFE